MDLRHIASLRWTAGSASFSHALVVLSWLGVTAYYAGQLADEWEEGKGLIYGFFFGIVVVALIGIGVFVLATGIHTLLLIAFSRAIGSKHLRASKQVAAGDPALVEAQRNCLRRAATYLTAFSLFDAFVAFLIACLAWIAFLGATD